MRKHAIGIAAALALIAQQGSAVARSPSSGNSLMPACRSFLTDGDRRDLIGQGDCIGTISTIFYFGKTHFGLCIPDGANAGQAVSVVIRYIDQRPERMHENFRAL